jgi:hypothetical protein
LAIVDTTREAPLVFLTEDTRAATDFERLWPAGVILEDGAAKAIARVEDVD